MTVEIRFAETPAERRAIYRLRYEIYIEELGFALPADHEKRVLEDTGDRPLRLLYAQVDDQIVGTLAMGLEADCTLSPEDWLTYDLGRFTPLVSPNRMCIISRFMTTAAFRGTDIPLQLLQAMFEFQQDRGIQLSFLDCRPHLITVYLRLGFRPYGKTENDPVAGMLVPMVMIAEDHAYLRKIGSPLLSVLCGKHSDTDLPHKIIGLLSQSTPVQTITSANVEEDWRAVYAALNNNPQSRIAIFDGVSDDELSEFLDSSHIVDCPHGTVIIKRGTFEQTMFIVLQGTVEVRDGDRLVAVEHAGGVVGELAFLLSTGRTADVVAASDNVRLLCLRYKALTELIQSQSGTAARILYNLSRILAAKVVGQCPPIALQ